MSMSSIDFLFFFLNKWHWHEPDYSAPGWSIFFFPGSYNHALVIDFTVAVLHFQPCLLSHRPIRSRFLRFWIWVLRTFSVVLVAQLALPGPFHTCLFTPKIYQISHTVLTARDGQLEVPGYLSFLLENYTLTRGWFFFVKFWVSPPLGPPLYFYPKRYVRPKMVIPRNISHWSYILSPCRLGISNCTVTAHYTVQMDNTRRLNKIQIFWASNEAQWMCSFAMY